MTGVLIGLVLIVCVIVFASRSRSTSKSHNNQKPQFANQPEVKHGGWHTNIELKTPSCLQKLDIDAEDELSNFVKKTPAGLRKEHYYRGTLVPGHEIAVGVTRGLVWIDVISRNRRTGEKQGAFTGDYVESGFHIIESRWSYGEGPPGATIIRKFLAEHFGTPEKMGRFV